MELDDFKAHWNTIQQKEFKQQKHTPETLNPILMNATNTLGQLHERNVYWGKLGKVICTALIVMLLMILPGHYFFPDKNTTFSQAVIYVAIMIIYALVTIWVYKRQQNIFTIYRSENLKETLTKTIAEFKRFYVLMNVIYLFLYPVYFYAFLKLFINSYWAIPTNIVLMLCGALTIVSLIGSHIYYKIKYFKRIASLEADLAELNEE
ncbi:hypothetical protein [Mucilaginibacter sp. OK098]|uniref:hypothetical protein n=1 Tax=Mucilaginibacter sp. OK098 TaxID=1855297 RepID=UPI000918DF67|nr:hypothetical protein [Mucilaginibacter sp. OK098]SHM75120.1 hypothetical protein SAMN05216524_103280 [Mucilaginibacter sp. OK098]